MCRKRYEVELEAIEDAFLKERDALLGGNKSEIDSLFEKRRSMELHYMDATLEREQRYQLEIDELRAKDAEDFNKLKIKHAKYHLPPPLLERRARRPPRTRFSSATSRHAPRSGPR